VHEWIFSGLLREIARRAKLRAIEIEGDSRRSPSAGCESDWLRDRKV
jgi:hypothetical protein